MALWYRVSFCMHWLQVHPPSYPFLVFFFFPLIYMTMSNSWARIAGKCRPHQSNASGNDLPETYPKFRACMYIHICTLTNTYTNLQKKRARLPQNKILATFLLHFCQTPAVGTKLLGAEELYTDLYYIRVHYGSHQTFALQCSSEHTTSWSSVR